MDETAKRENHLSSAAAFVEGGIQDACDDSCSICLEAFCDSEPPTVTSCKHEFHLQCILEWCQRSSHCPMCWQPIILKDPASQELLEAVEQERSIRVNRSHSSAIFHHPLLGDFELQHLPVGPGDAEFGERILQHLAAAAATGRTQHIARGEAQHGRLAAHGHPQSLMLSSNQSTTPAGSISPSSAEGGNGEITYGSPSVRAATVTIQRSPNEVSQIACSQSEQVQAFPSTNSFIFANNPNLSSNRNSAGQSTPVGQDRAGPSDFHSFSESMKSRLNSVSMRYKESITKSTRGWKERLFSRNSAISDLRSEVRQEVNAGIASVSRMMRRLETKDNTGSSNPTPLSMQPRLDTVTSDQLIAPESATSLGNGASSSTCVAISGSKT